MKLFFTIVFTTIFYFTSQGQNASFDKTRLLEINKWITSDVKSGKMQGAIVLITNKEGVLYSYVGGVSDVKTKRSLKKDDYFKLASMTKVITTVAVMQLYEKGLFDLDDPISKYLPEFKDLKVLETDSLVPAKKQITIKHLLNQTSGYAYGGPKISELYKEKKISFFNPKEDSLEAFIKKLSQMPLVAQPGEKFTYGPSTDILGYFIERLSNIDLETYYVENIFKPLQMHNTGFNIHKEETDRLVRAYGYGKENNLIAANSKKDFDRNHRTKVLMGGSGLISTAHDYLKFCQMLLHNGTYKEKKILSRKSIELMTKNQVENIKYPKGFNSILGENNTFGFGVNIITEPGSTNELYSVGSYFWEGSYSTSFIVDPKEGFTAVLMTQIGGKKSLKIRKKFRKYIYSSLK